MKLVPKLAAVTLAMTPIVTSNTVAQTPAAAVTSITAPLIVATRRITEMQYKHTVRDLFGADIVINGRFEPERRENLLLAIGSSMLSISAAGFDQYFAMAKTISEQIFDEKRRSRTLQCQPADARIADDACTETFVREYGRRLFRRPLTDDEVAARITLAASGAERAQDYYAGLQLAAISLLTAPQFLFRVETAEPDPATHGPRLDGYTKAARLSYLFWDTAPDERLLQAAANGELHTQRGIDRQITRLSSSPQLEDGARAFFSDMLQLDMYESLTKDALIFPKFSQAVADAAKEQTLKTVIEHLLVQQADYRDLFTAQATFLDRSLASIYRVPFVAPEGWMSYTFPDSSDQSGVLTQISFLGLFSHPGRSSPTKRGVAINEILLCEPTPLPPANVDFSVVNDTQNPSFKTVRSRLVAHSEDESCSGCHNKSDPLGLALERFDSLGQPRTLENGAPIDVSAQLGGKKFSGARGLGAVLHANPKVPACLVRNIYAYGTGRAPLRSERAYLESQSKVFAQDHYRFPSLLRNVAASAEFFRVVLPKPAPQDAEKRPSTIAGNPTDSAAGASS